MSNPIYVVLGATGNIGHVIANELLKNGKSVRVVNRHAEKAKPLADQGAEVLTGSVDDVDFLKSVFAGATAAFVMIPPNYQAPDHTEHQLKTGKAIAEALRGSSVKAVVNLSSYHANDENAPKILNNVYQAELLLNELPDVDVLTLRPAYFMENLFSNLPLIPQGIIGSMLPGDLAISMIATKDIGEYAAERLLKLDFTGKLAHTLLGQRDVSGNEIAKILGEALGKPLHYIQFDAAGTRQAMLGSGHLNESSADLLIEMNKKFSDGTLPEVARTEANTTPTAIEAFAQVFKAVYEASQIQQVAG